MSNGHRKKKRAKGRHDNVFAGVVGVPRCPEPEAPEPDKAGDGFAIPRRFGKLAAIYGAGATLFLSEVTKLYGIAWIPSFAHRLGGGTAVAIGGFQVVNSVYRLVIGHFKLQRIHGRLAAEFVYGLLTLAIGAAALRMQPSLLLFVALGLLMSVTIYFYLRVQFEIVRILEEERIPSGTVRWHLSRIYTILSGGRDRVSDMPRTRNRARLSFTRHVMILGLILVETTFVAAALASVVEGSGSSASPAATNELRTSSRQLAALVKQLTARPVASGRVDARGRWKRFCHSIPGHDAPRWAAQDLVEAYLGADHTTHPWSITGCAGPTHVSRRSSARFLYLVGRNRASSKLMSVAVDSQSFRPALFLRPAVRPVLAAIRQYGVLGGTSLLRVARGDAYGVYTPTGSIVLMRSQRGRTPGSKDGLPYVELVPAVAAAWFDAVRFYGRWLWARALPGAGAATTFELRASSATGAVLGTIDYDPAERVARWHNRQIWGRYERGLNITETEMARFGSAAAR